MAVALSATPLRLTDANGTILAGAKMYVYLAGTTTPTSCYTTSALSVAHANPLVADGGGLFDEAFFAPGDYKLTFKTSADVTLWEIDNYTVEASGSEINFPVFSKTANFSVTSTDRGAVFLVDASAAPGSNVNCTADSDELGSGFPFTVVSVGATGQCTVQGDGAQTVSGASNSIVSVQNAAVSYVSIGATGWQITSKDGVTASTTEALTGTNTTLAVTPNALAALWEKATAIAGGSTITFGEGGLFHITGSSWTCSDFDFTVATDGRTVRCVADGTGTITHNGTTLVCPGGRDVKVKAGDSWLVTQDSTDNVFVSEVRSINYDSEGMVKLQTQTASASSGIAFNLSAWPEYTNFTVKISGVTGVSDANTFRMVSATDSTPTYETGATDYWVQLDGYSNGSAVSLLHDGASSIIFHPTTSTVGNQAGETFGMTLDVLNPHNNALPTGYIFSTTHRNATTANPSSCRGGAGRRASQDTTYIKFEMSSGNISTGLFTLYGHR